MDEEKKHKVIEVFGGIGALSYIILGHYMGNHYNLEVTQYIDNDEKAVKAYNLIHNTMFTPQDINNVKKLDENATLLFAGFPCQDLSQANNRGKGLAGKKSSLIFTLLKLIKKTKYKPRVVIFENVGGLLSDEVFPKIVYKMVKMGYSYKELKLDSINYNSACYRKRVYLVFIYKGKQLEIEVEEKNESTTNLAYKLRGIINFEDYPSEKINKDGYIPVLQVKKYLYVKPIKEIGVKIQGEYGICKANILKNGLIHKKENGKYIEKTFNQGKYSISLEGKGPTITTKIPFYFIIRKGDSARMIHGKECFKLMGFKFSEEILNTLEKHFTLSDLYKLIGNSNEISVLTNILEKVKSELDDMERYEDFNGRELGY